MADALETAKLNVERSDQMGPEAASETRQEILATLSARRIEQVATNVIYAVAQKV